MPDNERLEREIEEILGKIENFPEPQARARRARKRRFVRVSEAFTRRQRQVAQQLHLDKVLQHIGVVACMKGVAVTQHGFGNRKLCKAQLCHARPDNAPSGKVGGMSGILAAGQFPVRK